MPIVMSFLLVVVVFLSSSHSFGAEIKVESQSPPAIINLSQEGERDWVHWGYIHGVSVLNRKASVEPVVGELEKLGNRELHTYETNPTTFTWSDGAPARAVKQTRSGLFTYGQDAGFQIKLPAGTRSRTVKIFCGVWRGQGRLEANLSDGSAAPVIATKDGLEQEKGDNVVFTIRYQAASADQRLILKWINTTNRGNVTFQAVSVKE